MWQESWHDAKPVNLPTEAPRTSLIHVPAAFYCHNTIILKPNLELIYQVVIFSGFDPHALSFTLKLNLFSWKCVHVGPQTSSQKSPEKGFFTREEWVRELRIELSEECVWRLLFCQDRKFNRVKCPSGFISSQSDVPLEHSALSLLQHFYFKWRKKQELISFDLAQKAKQEQ